VLPFYYYYDIFLASSAAMSASGLTFFLTDEKEFLLTGFLMSTVSSGLYSELINIGALLF
jgi:hypothetical protein